MPAYTLKLTYRDDNTLVWTGQDGEFREIGGPLVGKCADCIAEFGQLCEGIAVANGARDWYVVNERGHYCATRPLWLDLLACDSDNLLTLRGHSEDRTKLHTIGPKL